MKDIFDGTLFKSINSQFSTLNDAIMNDTELTDEEFAKLEQEVREKISKKPENTSFNWDICAILGDIENGENPYRNETPNAVEEKCARFTVLNPLTNARGYVLMPCKHYLYCSNTMGRTTYTDIPSRMKVMEYINSDEFLNEEQEFKSAIEKWSWDILTLVQGYDLFDTVEDAERYTDELIERMRRNTSYICYNTDLLDWEELIHPIDFEKGREYAKEWRENCKKLQIKQIRTEAGRKGGSATHRIVLRNKKTGEAMEFLSKDECRSHLNVGWTAFAKFMKGVSKLNKEWDFELM